MKERLVFVSAMIRIAILVLFLHSLGAHAASRPQSIKVVMDNTYPPYVFQNSAGELHGILIDQWKLWEQKTGIKVELTAMDWNEALRRMKAGEFDVIDTIFKTGARSGWLDFSKAYARLEVSAFFNKEISGISDAASLKDFVVAAKRGDDAVDVLKQQGVNNLLLFNSYEAIVRAAKEHKVTVFVVDTPPALYYLHKFGIVDHYKQSPPMNIGEFHRAVKKGNTELLKVIEDGFDRISPDEQKKIENTWFGSTLVNGLFLRYFYIAAGSLSLLILALFAWNRVLKKGIEHRTADLKASEERIALVLNSIAEGIYGVDLQGNCTFCNPAALRLLGYDRAEDVVGKKIHPLIHHTKSDGTHYHSKDCKVYCSYREGKEVHADDEVFWRSDGTSFPVEYWSQPIIRAGVSIGAVTAFADITNRKHAEEALRESAAFLNTLLDAIPIPVFYKDRDGRYLGFNSAFETFFGETRERLIGKTVFDISPPELAEIHHAKDVELFESGEVQQYESQVKNAHGLLRDVIFNKAVFVDSQGAVSGLIGTTLDITERKKLEDQLRQSQKMESIGTLAGGVAHDFNNMLTVIIGYGQYALMHMGKDDPQRASIEQILEAGDRAAQLTKDLLLFSRKQISERKPMDVNRIIRKVGMFLKRIIGEDVECETTLFENPMPVLGDAHQFEQVLMNLATNARDAMPTGGLFSVNTEPTRFDENFISAHGYGKPGNYALITISDTGIGMDEATREHLFEPFFTTKEVGTGTGLGLAVVYGIIKQHEGYVDVYSETGRGTTFKIYLPLIEAGVHEEIKATEEHPTGGIETILLAEDDKSVRNLMRNVLEHFGYKVITAHDGQDAVDKYKENKDTIRLLLFDIIMPKKTGKEAYNEIKTIRPDIKIIFQSGYAPDAVRQKALLDKNAAVVCKPISPTELLKLVRMTLDR